VYRELQPFWDTEALARVRAGRKPLAFEQLVAIDEHADHEANVRRLARSGEPAVVIAASGMCAGGRVMNYLKAMLHDPRHDVLFVGYQARGTPGHAIQAYGPGGGYVDLDGERITIRAGIHSLSGYSAHADQNDLVRFVTRMGQLPAEVRLIHGDTEARQALAERIVAETGAGDGDERRRTLPSLTRGGPGRFGGGAACGLAMPPASQTPVPPWQGGRCWTVRASSFRGRCWMVCASLFRGRCWTVCASLFRGRCWMSRGSSLSGGVLSPSPDKGRAGEGFGCGGLHRGGV
jgi:hypothetical protein